MQNQPLAPKDNRFTEKKSEGIVGAVTKTLGLAGAVMGYRHLKKNPQLAASIGDKISDIAPWITRKSSDEPAGSLKDIVSLVHYAEKAGNKKGIQSAVDLIASARQVKMGKGDYQPVSIADYIDNRLVSADKNLLTSGTNGFDPQGIKASLAKLSSRGIDITGLLNMDLKKGVVSRGGTAKDLSGFMPGTMLSRIIESVADIKIPLTSFKPMDIFQTKAFTHGQKFGFLNSKSSPSGQDMFIAGDRLINPSTGAVSTDKYNMIRNMSRLGRSYHITKGNYQDSSKKLDDMINSEGMGFFQNMMLKAQQKLRPLIGDRSDNMWLSPRYAEESSIAKNVTDWWKRITIGRVQAREGLDSKGAYERSSLVDKIKLGLGIETKSMKFVDPDGKVIGKKSNPYKSFGGKEDYIPGVHRENQRLKTKTGISKNNVQGQFLAIKKGSETRDTTAHFLTDRTFRIFESLTGIGVKPSTTATGNIVKASLGIGGAALGVYNALAYTNEMLFGVPAKAAGVGLGVAETAQQTALGATGASTFLGGLESMLPGSVNSLGGQVIRGLALPAIGMFAGARMAAAGKLSKENIDKSMRSFGKSFEKSKISGEIVSKLNILSPEDRGRVLGFGVGVAIAAATMIGDPTASVGSVINQQLGDERVAIRDARWWGLGRQPFEGGRIKYFDQSAAQKLWHYDAEDKAKYGSALNKFTDASWFPTPSNLFGLKTLAQPYEVETRLQSAAPYPQTGSAFGDVPLIGALLEPTIGQIVKPNIGPGIPKTGSGHNAPQPYYGMTKLSGMGAGSALGIGSSPINEPTPASPNSLMQAAGRFQYEMQDYTGMPGFIFGQFVMNPITGRETVGSNYEVAQASRELDNVGDNIWDANLGGMLGQTEMIRRMFPRSQNDIDTYNPLPNAMPDWLPGSRSIFDEDRASQTDFTTGNAYSKIENGWRRLPGAGYEEMNGLHGGDHYDVHDMYRILSDVAPGSSSHRFYAKKLRSEYDKGYMKGEDARIFERTEEENRQKMSKYEFSDYQYQSSAMSDQVGVLLGEANQGVKDRAKANKIASLFGGGIWESLTHTQIPGASWLQGKFMNKRTPLEQYRASRLHSEEFADWASPYEGFLRPAATELGGAVLGDSYVPEHRQRERQVTEYFDKVKYLKARRLESHAKSIGNESISRKFSKMADQTVVGLNPQAHTSFNKNVFQAFSAPDRPFLPSFVNASVNEAERIVDVLPEYQRKAMLAAWRENGTTSSKLDQMSQKYGSDRTDRATADLETAEYFKHHALPDADWEGWAPDIDLDEVKTRVSDSESISLHNLGISQSKARQFNRQRTLYAVDTNSMARDDSVRDAVLRELSSYNDAVPQYNRRFDSGSTVTIEQNRQAELYAMMRNSF